MRSVRHSTRRRSSRGMKGLDRRRFAAALQSRRKARGLFCERLEGRLLLAVDFQGIAVWTEQGPGPISLSNGFIQAGAIEAVAVDPTDSNRIFVGTVNGGVWRTTTGTYSPSDGLDNDDNSIVDDAGEYPSWEALTDQFTSLSISAIAISPQDPSSLYAGTGRTSAGFGDGGASIGLLRSTDGGDSWMQVGPELIGRRVRSVVPTGQNDGMTSQEVVLVASDAGSGGVYRSTDGGTSFSQVSGSSGSADGIDNDGNGLTDEIGELNLPAGPATHLVADPGNPNRYYAALPQIGIFRSDDLGQTWQLVNGTGANSITGITSANFRTELAVHNSGGIDVVYAAIMRNDIALPAPFNPRTNRLFAVFRSTDQGANWRQLQNMPVISPGAQAGAHFAMVAHPTNPNVLFVGGDAPDPSLAPAQMTRYRMVANDGNPALDTWQLVADSGTVDNTRPHADTRDMAFATDGNGNPVLINTDDGGIYRLFDPDSVAANRRWESMNGDIRVTESYSVAYDALNGTLVTGTQDNGTSRQRAVSDPLFPFDWSLIQGCDGAVVAVDNDQTAHPNETIIYTNAQNFTACGGLQRRTIDNTNTQTVAVGPGLVVGGTGGRTLTGPGTLNLSGALLFDNTIQFIQPYVLNEVDPTRLLIGTNYLYESTDQGDTLTSLGGLIDLTNNGVDDDGDGLPDPDPDEWAPANPVGAVRQASYAQSTPIAYGGSADGVLNPDVLWIGAGGNLLLRTTPGGMPSVVSNYTSAAVGGGAVTDIVMDPDDWHVAYVVDVNGSVFRAETNDSGSSVTFTNLTGNLSNFATDLRTIEFIRTGTTTVLLVGGQNGVYRAINPSAQTEWSEFGLNLPNAPVNDLQYYSPDEGDVLAVGLFGRGVWTIENASIVAEQQGALTICGDENGINQDDQFVLVRNDGNPQLLDVIVNGVREFQAPLVAVHQINVFGQGGNDSLTVDVSYGLIDVPGGIRYDGDGLCWDLEDSSLVGLDRGFDSLIVTQSAGAPMASEFLYVGNLPGSGRSVVTDSAGRVQTIDFEELEPVLTDVAVAAFALTSLPDLATLLDQSNTLEIVDARILPAGVRVTIDNFEPVEFSQKEVAIIESAAGDDDITISNSVSDGVLTILDVWAGGGRDRMYLERAYDDVATIVRGGLDNDLLDASSELVTGVTLLGDSGHDVLIGGGGDDVLDGGLGDDLLEAGGGDNSLIGGEGLDTVVVRGTSLPDLISISQDTATNLTIDVNGTTRLDTVDTVESLVVDAGLAADIIRINQADGLVATPQQSLSVYVDGGPDNAADRLIVNDDGLGDLVVASEAFDGQSGVISVGPLGPIGYEGIEKTTITPLNSATGGTGSDGLGRLFVFKPDPHELNDARVVATHLGITPVFLSDLSITPGSIVLPAPFGAVPGDEDWYEFMPAKTGTFRFDVLFERIVTLPNGRAGLPNDGNLDVEVYNALGSLIGSANSLNDDESLAISMLENRRYFLRVYGAQNAINMYDLNIVEVDLAGPIIDSVNVTGESYDLFDPKPHVDGPTPPITSLTIAVTDPPPRAPGDLYPALNSLIAAQPGHYLLVGDHTGPIAVSDVIVTNHAPVVGSPATATIELRFFEPLPDDRYTLSMADQLTDPADNQLDGETNAVQPLENPQFPSGDGVSGGDFVARFTVDSRPEIGVTASTRVYVDINGNLIYDPQGDGDATNRDLVFRFGVESDAYFAGNFSAANALQASGFDKLGAFGFDPLTGRYRFLLDFDHNGVADFYSSVVGLTTSALPVAGDFDPAHPGDEIGLFRGDRWYLDTNGDNIINVHVDTTIATSMRGIPVVGDVNGDGQDDLIVFDAGQDIFFIDWNRDGVVDDSISFGLPDFVERPVVGDLNLDGVDDLGFWVAGSDQKIGEGKAEWHFLISDRVPPGGATPASSLFDPYSPDPLGNDLFAHFGDRYALPIFGNFDPPVVGDHSANDGHLLSLHNAAMARDVNGDGRISPIDALLVIDRLNSIGTHAVPDLLVQYREEAPYCDVSNDRRISPIDVLMIIDYLNQSFSAAEGESVESAAEVNPSMLQVGVAAGRPVNALEPAPDRSITRTAVRALFASSPGQDGSMAVLPSLVWGEDRQPNRKDHHWTQSPDWEELLALLGEDVSDHWSTLSW